MHTWSGPLFILLKQENPVLLTSAANRHLPSPQNLFGRMCQSVLAELLV